MGTRPAKVWVVHWDKNWTLFSVRPRPMGIRSLPGGADVTCDAGMIWDDRIHIRRVAPFLKSWPPSRYDTVSNWKRLCQGFQFVTDPVFISFYIIFCIILNHIRSMIFKCVSRFPKLLELQPHGKSDLFGTGWSVSSITWGTRWQRQRLTTGCKGAALSVFGWLLAPFFSILKHLEARPSSTHCSFIVLQPENGATWRCKVLLRTCCPLCAEAGAGIDFQRVCTGLLLSGPVESWVLSIQSHKKSMDRFLLAIRALGNISLDF